MKHIYRWQWLTVLLHHNHNKTKKVIFVTFSWYVTEMNDNNNKTSKDIAVTH